MKLDDIFVDRIGDWGRFQALATVLVAFANVPLALHTVSLIFIGGGEQSYWCGLPTDEFVNLSHEALKDVFIPSKLGADGVKVYSTCEIYNLDNISRQAIFEATDHTLTYNRTFNASGIRDNQTPRRRCNAWHYKDDGIYKTSLLTQYSLYCEREWLLPLAQTLFMAGWLTGNFVFGSLADRFGRMKVVPLGFLVNTALGIAMPFIPNYFVYILFRYLIGITSGGPYTVLYVLAMELCGKKYRTAVASVIACGFNLALGIIAGMGYAMAPVNHITMQLIFGCLPFILVFYYWILPESPRWLVSMHRYEEAKDIIKKIAKFNRRPESKCEDDIPFEDESTSLPCNKIDSHDKPSEKKYTALDLFRTPNIRRITIASYFQWFSVAFIWTEFETALIVVVFFGKLCNVLAFDTIWLHSAEIFPTCIRAVGVSTGCLMARFGALMSPLIAKLATIQTSLPLIVFASVAVIATILCIQLPETNKRNLPETIEDGEEFAKFSLSCPKPCKKKRLTNKLDPTLFSV